MNSSSSAAGLGLLAATTWGGSDFVGGLGARRAPALLVVASGHIVSLFALLILCRALQLPMPGRAPLLYAALGGFEGSLALALFYRALSMGAMSLTAAFTGLITAIVPVLFSVVQDGLPTPLIALGLALGLAAIWLITHAPNAEQTAEDTGLVSGHDFSRAEAGTIERGALAPAPTPPTALILAALAGIGFGSQLILFKMAGAGGLLWTMTSARAAGSLAMLLLLAVMPPKGPWRGFWLPGILAGALDTLGNLFYIQASRFGRLDVAAVVCSLYPAGTILLAGVFLRERPTRRQIAGMAVALAAVALLSV